MPAPFTPPSMLHMPFANMADRRAAQEDAYMAWCEQRDHEAQALRRAQQNIELQQSGTPAGEPRAVPPCARGSTSSKRKAA